MGWRSASGVEYCGWVAEVHPFLASRGPIAFAHRGGTSVYPENSERAFGHAVDLGYSHIETDVQATSDGVGVICHDDRLDRTTDLAGDIAELSWSEVSRARIGGTEPILRVEELLEAFPDTRINFGHEVGIHVHVWGVDDPAEMHRLLDLGVDGLMTDEPEVLKSVLCDRGVWES